MHVVRVELENIKSHLKAAFDFERGTTAITGSNGAGKTTIIEAIAWALFNFLDYNKSDFVTRGEKKGSVRVTVETQDQKQYTIYRDTGSGYYVFDPTIKSKIAEKTEEVNEFIRRILQVEPGTDLKELFQTAIGVPQGTFTADFLLSRELRKKKFDKLLKVEEYRNAAEKLKATLKLIDGKRVEVWERVLRAETQIEALAGLEASCSELASRRKETESSLGALSKEMKEMEKAIGDFESLRNQAEEILQKIARKEIELRESMRRAAEKKEQVGESEKAAERQKQVEADYQAFLSASDKLKNLQENLAEKNRIANELGRIDGNIRAQAAELRNLREHLVSAKKAGEGLAAIKASISEFHQIEAELKESNARLAKAQEAEKQLNAMQADLSRLREDFRKGKANIEAIEASLSGLREILAAAGGPGIAEIEMRRNKITEEIASFSAKMESDQRFEREVKNGLCPILSQKCLNIPEGENLKTYFKGQFKETSGRLSGLRDEYEKSENLLSAARQFEAEKLRLAAANELHEQVTSNGRRLKTEKERLEKLTQELPGIRQGNQEIEAKLRAIGNPLEREKFLKAEADKGPELASLISEAEKGLATQEKEAADLEMQLMAFSGIEARIAEANSKIEQNAAAQKAFLESEGIASLLEKRLEELASIEKELKEDEARLETLKKQNDDILGKYDRGAHLELQAAFDGMGRREAILETELKQIDEGLKEKQAEIRRLRDISTKLEADRLIESRIKAEGDAAAFISDTLKKAAPEVAKMLLVRISQEANFLFRELTGNAEQTLSWKEDYEILLEEGGYERPFATLSGGEQMSASLSVRLALLQELSDVRFAFFDEPTVNMDAERREKLALAITQINDRKKFDQLFVISHDDTFESHTDYVVSVSK